MARRQDLRAVAFGGLGAILLMGIMAQVPMAIRADGIQFTDGTVQTTAAGATTAWPMTCYHAGSIPSPSGADLTCFSYTVGDPDAWGSSNGGVPAGYYFLVTDVLIQPVAGTSTTGIVDVRLYQSYSSGNRTSLHFRSSTDLETRNHSHGAPILILLPGDYLSVGNGSDSDVSVEVDVFGYLTADPGTFRP